jgi:putative DNA primase/helicase
MKTLDPSTVTVKDIASKPMPIGGFIPGNPEYDALKAKADAGRAAMRAEAEAEFRKRPWTPGTEDGDQADWLEVALDHNVVFNYTGVAKDNRKGQWHVFDSKTGLWLPDNQQDTIERVDELNVERLQHLILNDRPSKARDQQERAMKSLRNKGRIDSALDMLSSRDAYKTDGSIFDTDPFYLGVKNGAVDLRTAEFTSGPELRRRFITKATAVEWPKKEEAALRHAELFVDFVRDIMSGDEGLTQYVLRLFGYVTLGVSLEEKFWLFIGEGRNGKGTLVKLIHWLLGTYSHFAPSNLYIRNKFGDPPAQVGRPEFLALRGIRYAPTSEPVKGRFNEEVLKAHTGRDPITARALHSNVMVTFDPTFKLIFLAQQAPSVEDVGPSMRARARVIRFEQSYVGREDNALGDSLRRAAPGILVLLARQAAAYWRDAGLNPDDTLRTASATGSGLEEPAKVTEWSKAYVDANDPLREFIADACRVEKDATSMSAVLHDAFTSWWRRTERDGQPYSTVRFAIELEKAGFRGEKGRLGKRWSGIAPLGAVALADQEGNG